MLIKEVSEENFSKLLSENNSVLVFFRTDWCPLCNDVEKILTKIESKYNQLCLFIIDFDKNETLVNNYGIFGIPTVVTFKCGEITACFPGLRENYEEIAVGVLDILPETLKDFSLRNPDFVN